MRAGKDELQSLEGMTADGFKGFLKDRPLRLEFKSALPTSAPTTPRTPQDVSDTERNKSPTAKKEYPEGTVYEVVADASVGKMGIAFNGMPPGQLTVKNVADGSFGAEQSVSEGHILLRAGKDELQSLEGMTADSFKGFLKGRPLRLEFKSALPTSAPATPRGEGDAASSLAPSSPTTPREVGGTDVNKQQDRLHYYLSRVCGG